MDRLAEEKRAKDACNEAAIPSPGCGTQQATPGFHHGYERGYKDGARECRDAVEEIFNHHSPDEMQLMKINAIRAAAKHFARIVMQNTPHCADRRDALRKIREAAMTANAAVVLDGFNF